MTVEFRVLPVQEAVSWIRAWTDREWPMGIPEAFGIRDRLAWRPAPDDGTLFTTKLSDDGREDGFIDDVDERGNVEGVRFPLSSRGGDGEDAICDPLARSAYRAYVDALSELWGAPSDNTRNAHTEHSWVLPNDVTVRLGGLSALITVEIGSPSITQLDREIAYYEEKGYLTPGTLDVS